MLGFDEKKLHDALEGLKPALRAVFAAACAERLMPAYVKFVEASNRGASGVLQGALSALWKDLLGETSLNTQELAELVAAVMKEIPDEDDEPWVGEQGPGQDAASAVAYALRCRQSGAANEAAWAARCAYEALDSFVVERGNVNTSRKGSENQVIAHPLLQAELRRQQRDVAELSAADEDHRRMVGAFRERSRIDSHIFFGQAP